MASTEVFVNSPAQPGNVGPSHLSNLNGLDAHLSDRGGVMDPLSFFARETGQVGRHIVREQ